MPPIKAAFWDLDVAEIRKQCSLSSFQLKIVQEPREARTISARQSNKGSRWPVDPPPILELVSSEPAPELWLHIHNPNWFCSTTLEIVELDKNRGSVSTVGADNFTGQQVSSLHKVKYQNSERGYFAFGDLNIKLAGRYKLRFTLFELRRGGPHVYAERVHSVISQEFKVHSARSDQVQASSELSKALSEAGVKIRIRKEATKRRAYQMDWSSKPHESLNRPATLAPLQRGVQTTMAPPPPGSARATRVMGEDISGRIVATTHDLLNTNHMAPSFHIPTRNDMYYPQPRQSQNNMQRDGIHNWPGTATMLSNSPTSAEGFDGTSNPQNYFPNLQPQLGWSASMPPVTQVNGQTGTQLQDVPETYSGNAYGSYIPSQNIPIRGEANSQGVYPQTATTMSGYTMYPARDPTTAQPSYDDEIIETHQYGTPATEFTFRYETSQRMPYPGSSTY